MKAKLTSLLGIAGLLGMAATANAVISITPANSAVWNPHPNGNPTSAEVEAFILTAFGIECDEPLEEAYKQNAGGAEEKAFAASYATTLNGDLSGGSVTWNGPGTITGDHIFFFVKDGNPEPFYVYNLTGWNGTEQLDFSGFYPGNGAISHVSIYTCVDLTPTPREVVPEGGASVALLGLALAGIGLVGKELRKS